MVFRCLGINFNCKLCVKYVFIRYSSTVAAATRESDANLFRTRAQTLSNVLQCSLKTALLMMRRNKKIIIMDSSDLQKAVLFCKKNFRASDIIEYPSVISIPPRVLDNRLQSLQELGFKRVSANQIIWFKKAQTSRFKETVFLNIDEVVAGHFGDLQIPKEEMLKLKTEVTVMHANSHSLTNIKAKLNLSFLRWKLQLSQKKLDDTVKRYSKLRYLNLKNMTATISVLSEKCQFSLSKIAQNTFLLAVSGAQLNHLLLTMPTILGVDIKTLLLKCPPLCSRTTAAFQKVEKLLGDHGITTKQLQCCPKILTLKPCVIKHRLEALQSNKDCDRFWTDDNFLTLVYRYTKLSCRMKLLKLTKSSYNFKMLLLPNCAFRKHLRSDNYLKFGKDLGKYLSEIFNCSSQSVFKNLRDYPAPCNYTILNAQDVIDFLLQRGISKEQLWNGLGIIAYEKEIVEHFFNNLPLYDEFQPFTNWIGHFNLVQLLIYTIERNKNSASAVLQDSIIQEIVSDEEIADNITYESSEVAYFSEDEDEAISDMYKI